RTMRSRGRRVSPLGLAVSLTVWVGCGMAGKGASAPGSGDPPARDDAPAPATAPPARPFVRYTTPLGDPYLERFVALWNDIHDPKNGYFSPKGIPYHAAETLICEAPDYGHETTSEAYSYWVWLEAMYGRVSRDWSYLQDAWANLEANIIPGQDDQP